MKLINCPTINVMRYILKKKIAIFAFISIITFFGYAQAKPPISRIDPGRLSHDIFKALSDQKTSKFKIPKAPKRQLPKKSVIKNFLICELLFEGVTVYKEKSLQKEFCKYVNGKTTLHKLYEVTDVLTKKYRDDGYILSQVFIPAQRIKKGTVVMQVVEGFIGDVFVDTTNVSQSTKNIIQKYANKLTYECPLHLSRLERYALLANDIPGVQVQTYLKPSRRVCGASDVNMVAKGKKVDFNMILSNETSKRYGNLMLTVGGFVNDIYMGSRTGLIVKSSSSIKRMQLYNFTHSQLLNSEGLRINFTGQYIKNKPEMDNATNDFDINGDSYVFSTSLSYPLVRSRQTTVTINSTFDTLNTYSKTDLSGIFLTRINERIRSLRGSVNLEYLDTYFGNNLLAFEISQGLKILDSSNNSNINKTRNNGHYDYTKINFDFSRLQTLPKGFSIMFATEGQYAFNELLSAEEFGVGGPNIGRGYDSSEIVGDHGLSGKIELRYQKFNLSQFINHMQYYMYVDMGRVWNINKIKSTDSDQPKTTSLISGGIGARINIKKNFVGNIEIAQPINRNLAQTNNRKPRVFFTLQYMV